MLRILAYLRIVVLLQGLLQHTGRKPLYMGYAT